MRRLEDQNMALALQLETATGRPASDWGSIPATPSGLSLPNQASPHSEPASAHLISPPACSKSQYSRVTIHAPPLLSCYPLGTLKEINCSKACRWQNEGAVLPGCSHGKFAGIMHSMACRLPKLTTSAPDSVQPLRTCLPWLQSQTG